MDFYLIQNDAPKPHPSKLTGRVGRLEYDEFEALQKLKIIENHLDYYQSFRWSSQDVEKKLRKISETVKDKTSELIKFKDILTQAYENHVGIIAYGD